MRTSPRRSGVGPRLALTALAACTLAPTLLAQEASSCITCHAKEAAAEHERPHERAGVTCTDCHGGDASKPTKEAAKEPGTGYRGVPQGTALVLLCGQCHADVTRMNPYGLPTDQLAQYRTSVHGQMLFDKGDTTVATCTSCHGAHGILGPESSESPVHPTNVPATCARCHADADLMKAHGTDPGIPAAYRSSVHGKALLEKGDESAPECATCHGSHGAAPPGVSTVAEVCGKCHLREKELFQQSPHFPLVADGEFPGCETCHSNHAIQPATTKIFESMCSLCHGGDAEPLARRDRILAAVSSTGDALEAARKKVEAAAQLGLVTEDDRLLLEEASTAVQRSRVVQHALDPAKVEETTDPAREDLQQLSEKIANEGREQRLKRVSLVPVVLFLVLMSLGFWMRHRRIEHARRGA